MKNNNFRYQKEPKQNPYIGFTSFQHFREDELYSDLIVKSENNMTETEHVECYPIPDYVEENGRSQGYYPDCSVAYIRILWKEFEPKQGEYNYSFIYSILEKAKKSGQSVMFRLMPHSTRESDDVPDWLKTFIDCPARPKGERVKESPSAPEFLYYFGRAIRKIGERFDGDPTLAFLDISLPGAWGEGSSTDLFTQEQLKDFVDSYVGAFQNTLLIGQMAPVWIVRYLNERIPVGWRADCIGKPKLTYEFVPQNADQMSDVWKKGHVSFESYWWLGEWQRQGWDLDKIIQTTLDWHVSTFNAKSLPIPWEWKDKVDRWVSKMGYHFTIDGFSCREICKRGETLQMTLAIDNVGVAPIYRNIPLYIRLINDDGCYEQETPLDIREWLPGKHENVFSFNIPICATPGHYRIEVAIGGKNDPKVYFATNAERKDNYYKLSEIVIE